jgi:hypothetical protein
LRAGKEPPLGPIQRTTSAPSRVTVGEREKKIREAERQLQKAEIEGKIIGKEEEIMEPGPESRFQTRRTKAMISPSARDAPRFSSRRPQELRRFLRQMEDLWDEAGIIDDEEKKYSLGKYADQESEEEWGGLDTFQKGNTWNEFKEELIVNYPEAAEAERGTPARIKQLCRDTKGIKLGDLGAFYTFRRAFIAEARKLSKDPPAMANRELVELFMGALSPGFASEVMKYLGNKVEIGKLGLSLAGDSKAKPQRRPEDRYDLKDVYKAALQVSENSQGMFHLMDKSADVSESRKESSYTQYQSEAANLVQKLESLENNQAAEKDKIEITNKNLDNRFNELEKMMKNMISQVQNGTGNKEPVGQYDPNNRTKLGQPGTIPKWIANGRNNEGESKCFYCGGKGHYIPDCDELKEDLRIGYVKVNEAGKLRLSDGGYIPATPNGASIKERVGKNATLKKQNQFYCGYDEDGCIPELEIPRYPAQFVNTKEDVMQRHARLEKELEREKDELELRKLRLEREERRKREANKENISPQVLELLEQMVKKDDSKVDFH